MATDLCFPIIKYSHATGVRSDNTVPWTHLQAQNLFAIIKGVDTHYPDGRLHPDGKLDMRIVQGTDVLVREFEASRYSGRLLILATGDSERGTLR